MEQSIQKVSEWNRLGFFPTPYPDECYFSILSRFMVHSGIPSTNETMIALFGRSISPRSTLVMPYLSSKIKNWVQEDTGITEKKIIGEHTAFGFFSITYGKKERSKILERLREGTVMGHRPRYKGSLASERLQYCPLCAYEECVEYGEMYWHRLHQLDGSCMCIKHGVYLKKSDITLQNIKKRLIPASFALRDKYRQTLEECVENVMTVPAGNLYRHSAVQKDIVWLMEHWERAEALEKTLRTYDRLLYEKGWTESLYGHVKDMQALKRSVIDYFGISFLKELNLTLHEYFEWETAPTIIMKFLTPLQHVLLMEYLCGSVESFWNRAIGATDL